MTFILHRNKYPVRELTDFNVKENDLLKIADVSEVGIREGDERWRTSRVNGEVNLMEHLGIQGTPDDYDLKLDGHELTLSVGRKHFTEPQVDEMVAFLQSQEYRLDMRKSGGQVSRTFSALHEDISAFLEHWHELEEVVQSIVRRPGEQLISVLQEVSLQHRQRHNASTLALNLRTGRLNELSDPSTESVYALTEQVTLDIAENSHLVRVVEAYEKRRDLLVERAERHLQNLEIDIERENSYDSSQRRIKSLVQLHQTMLNLKSSLQALEAFDLPEFWRSFRHKPSTSTNRARFDECYGQAIALEEHLQENTIRRRPPHAPELIQECGRRATWQLYEYWLVAQIFTQLIELGFNCDEEDGFQSFEDWQGASYGLVENRHVNFTHASGLRIRMTYEQHVPWQEDGKQTQLKPDIVLEFVDLEKAVPLVLDAKYKSYSPKHKNLGRDLEKSARRYGRALAGAMSFLVHAGNDGWQVWPSRSKHTSQPPKSPFKVEDLPLNYGVVSVFPGSVVDGIVGDVRPLRRLLVTWLIRHGIFWVCFNCGVNLKDQQTARAERLPGEQDLDVSKRHVAYTVANRNWPKFASYQCPCCDMTGMLTFCGSCAKGANGHWSPIFKYVPREIEGKVDQATATAEWSKTFEIHHVSGDEPHMRHCAWCGATK